MASQCCKPLHTICQKVLWDSVHDLEFLVQLIYVNLIGFIYRVNSVCVESTNLQTANFPFNINSMARMHSQVVPASLTFVACAQFFLLQVCNFGLNQM